MPTPIFRFAVVLATLTIAGTIAPTADAQIPTLPSFAGQPPGGLRTPIEPKETTVDVGQPPEQPGVRRTAPQKAVVKKPAPKVKKAKAPASAGALRGGAIVVTNNRDSNLLELTATPPNGGAAIVIARDVAPGARAAGKLPPRVGCIFSLSGSFEDESTTEAANMNLCKDGRINLVE